MASLFQQKIEPRCAYCANGRPMSGGQVVCPKKGVMDGGSHCRKFTYDPLRRTPPRVRTAPPEVRGDEEFTL